MCPVRAAVLQATSDERVYTRAFVPAAHRHGRHATWPQWLPYKRRSIAVWRSSWIRAPKRYARAGNLAFETSAAARPARQRPLLPIHSQDSRHGGPPQGSGAQATAPRDDTGSRRFYYPGLGSCKSRDSANSISRTVRNGQESSVWRSAIAWLSRAQQAARVPEAAFRWWNPSGSHAGVFGVSCLHTQSDTRSHRWSERTDIEHETASSRAYGPQGGFLACVPRLQPIEASL